MAFQNHLSDELAMPQYVERKLAAGTPAMLRKAIDQFTAAQNSAGASSSEEEDGTGDGNDFHRLMDGVGKPALAGGSGPTWLNSAILQQHGHGSFLHLQTAPEADALPGWRGGGEGYWFPRPPILRSSGGEEGEEVPVSSDSIVAAAMSSGGGEGSGLREIGEPEARGSGGATAEGTWQNARCKAEILAHPLYEQLLSAHVSCLRIATPVDQLQRIDGQLALSQQVVSKYSALGGGQMIGDNRELDQFMTHYVLLLSSFREQLQQHVRVHAMEAVMTCWELEQSLQSLTGVSPGEGTGATMSDDEDDQEDGDTNLLDGSLDEPVYTMGFGSLVPTETERSLMERVRQELKHELKQGYKGKIVDIREEILRKRKAGRLPGDSTSTLKAWWQSHSKWPYPTEDDKTRLVQETGLQLKQINNWFINQRKRNWHSTNPSSSSTLKTKRKRFAINYY
ncbi:homeobox protein knotted-1-like 13 isoform X1 [Zingiber officinale]|uniref:homeobox protein knotted-1-like 13 isoform X1 n=1 Tax=Zingiber officinale TaxID=94328 RepID=UPI001C4BB866|nr:homeobox protein knotted-1-like 13 isoform X1 [Zingiber officinale]